MEVGGEDDMEPYNGPTESTPSSIDPDLVREEMVEGSCDKSGRGMPKTAAALQLLGAGQPYKNNN